MQEHTRLPDAEFEVMQVIWSQPACISSLQVFTLLGPKKSWKQQTVLTLLTRLTRKGFLSSEKHKRERYYTALVSQDEYIRMETGYFIKKLHRNSLTGLMNALYANADPNEQDLSELEQWLKERR